MLSFLNPKPQHNPNLKWKSNDTLLSQPIEKEEDKGVNELSTLLLMHSLTTLLI